jgi:hypothetical protein
MEEKSESVQKQIFSVIKEITGQANILPIPKTFIDYTGNLEDALLLSQILYWSDKGKDGWFFKTYEEWKNETTLSEYKVRAISNRFKEEGILKTKIKKVHGNPTLHYKIDETNFVNSFLNFLRGRPSNSLGFFNNTEITNSETTLNSFSLKNKEKELRKPGFSSDSVSTSKPILKLRKKPDIAKPTRAEEIRSKKETLAKPPIPPIVVPNTIQEYLDVWTNHGFKLPGPQTKTYERLITAFKQLKRGSFFRNKPDKYKLDFALSIDQWELIVERYQKSLQPEYLPADKSWLRKITILQFLYDPYGKTCCLLDFLNKEPELRIQNVYPDLTKTIISCYSEMILNNPTYKPTDKDLEKFILAGNRTGEFFVRNQKRIPTHFNLTIHKKAQLLIRAVKKEVEGKTDFISPGFLCSDLTFDARLPKYLTDQAMLNK